MKKTLIALTGALVLGGTLGAPAVLAAPTIPDTLPIFGAPAVAENPQITVTDAQGNLITGPVQRGDVLYVHGSGFDAQANRGGFPLPVPAGQPNGVYVLYGAFPDDWRPSADAPSANRKHPHDRMSWVITDAALAAVPSVPLNMQRTITRVHDTMQPDGTFRARIVVDPPEQPTGTNWGVYVYPAAGSINAAEEIYVPLAFDPTPGTNTSAAPSPDLLIDAAGWQHLATAAGGAVTPTAGAALDDAGTLSFSRAADQGDGVVRYTGTATSTARFALAATSVQDPWFEPNPDGTWTFSAAVSTSIGAGTDSVQRVPLGRVHSTTGTQEVYVGAVPVAHIHFTD